MSSFFFNDTATTEIYTLSLHDALPILLLDEAYSSLDPNLREKMRDLTIDLQNKYKISMILVTHDKDEAIIFGDRVGDRKSTRLNSSHANISYAVFCLKKKKTYNKLNTL